MLLLWCLLVTGDLDFQVNYQSSGVYESHLTRRNAAVNSHGEVFILNVHEGLVYQLSQNGEKPHLVGGKGQGPGQYVRPEQVFVDGDQLFVIDQGSKRILCYQRDGTFKEQFTAPIGMELDRVRNGWIYGNWRRSRPGKEPVAVYFGDHELTNETRLVSWPRGGDQIEMVFSRKSGQALTIPYSPVRDYPHMAVTFSGDYAYLYQPGDSLRIHVVDLAARKLHAAVVLPAKRFPFDTEWGNRLMEEETRLQRKRGDNIKHIAHFPQYFPAASLLCTNEVGDLVIGRMRGGSSPMDYLVVNHNGEPADPAYPPKYTYRIIAVHGEYAWVSVLVEEEAAVIRVPISKLSDTFEKYG